MRFTAGIILTAFFIILLSAQSFAGDKAPEFALKDLDGKFVALSSLKGSVVIINFWALWCPPCREELPELNKLYGRYGGRIKVLAVSVDSAGDLKEYVRKNPVDFTVLADGFSVSKKYGVYAIPTSFIIDARGNIVEKYPGWVDWSSPEIAKRIDLLLREAS